MIRNRDQARRILDHQEFKRALPPLTAVLEHYGLLTGMKRRGTQLFSKCPIHNGSNPKQFVVRPETDEWKCFSPAHDTGGSTIEFVMAMQNCDFPEAVRHIERWFSMPNGNTINQRQRRSKAMSEGQRPSHKCFVVEDRAEGDERDAFWTRVGSAWPHKDGKGLNIQIASGLSVAGRVVLREYTAEDEENDKKANRAKR